MTGQRILSLKSLVVAEIVDAYPTLTEEAVQGALRELAHEKEAAVV